MPTNAEGPREDTYRAALLDVLAGAPEAFLHPADATRIGVRPLDRIRIALADDHEAEFPAVVNVSGSVVGQGTIGLSRELASRMRLPGGARLTARPAPRPESVQAIRRKLDGHEVSAQDMSTVIRDIAGGHLTPIELTYWAAGVHAHGMSIDETVACVQAMVATGERIEWGGAAMHDVHSIGGVPGNKYAPIVVAICAAAGLKVPKTSSRAISSACGTADFMEVLAPVALDAARMKAVVQEAGATLAWGGGIALAPADDEIIRVEYPLSLDPPSQIIASVLAKKVAMGVTHVLIDIPTGLGAKVRDAAAADRMAESFRQVGQHLGLVVRCVVTPGGRPLGQAIGPVLEAREMLATLEAGKGPADLVAKACDLAGLLLEMSGKQAPGRGRDAAQALLASGAAHRKLLQVLAAQGGSADVRAASLLPGAHAFVAQTTRDGRFELDNAALVAIARAAGAPHAKGAGVVLLANVGEPVRTGQECFRVHAETAIRLEHAWDATQRLGAFQCRKA